MSQNQCQLYGCRLAWNGCSGAGPSHRLKSKLVGGVENGRTPRLERPLPGLLELPWLTSSSPYLPDCTAAFALANDRLLRLCVPCCTTRPYFFAASTHWRPSKTLWLIGFSTYTSLPAWQAQMVISECQ